MAGVIATVSEPASSVGWRDGREGGPGGGAEVVIGPGFGPTEGLLDLGEGVFDGIEVRGVGREVAELGPARLDGGAGARGVVGAQVVGDDHLPRPEGRGEDVADVTFEARPGHAAVEPQQGPNPVEGDRRDDGLVLARVARGGRVGTLPAWRPRMRRGVAEVTARLIQEDQVGRRDRRDPRAPGVPRGRVLLTGPQRLFLRVHPSRVSARLIVAVLTSAPETSRHQEHCSAKVASERAARRSGKATTRGSVFTATGPGTGFGARLPVSRRCRNHRSMVGTDTAKAAATSRRGVPFDTARTTRHRRSSEYGFIPTACQNHQAWCNLL